MDKTDLFYYPKLVLMGAVLSFPLRGLLEISKRDRFENISTLICTVMIIITIVKSSKRIPPLAVAFTLYAPSFGFLLCATWQIKKSTEKRFQALFSTLENPIVMKLIQPFLRYEMEFISASQVDRGVMLSYADENVEDVIKQVSSDMKNDLDLTLLIISFMIMMVLSILSLNPIMMVAGIIFFVAMWPRSSVESQWHNMANVSKFHGQDGIYAINQECFGRISRVGVAYAHKGIVQSRYHVTGSKTITYQDVEYRPTFSDTRKDIITWGGAGTYVTPADGQKVIVEILPVDACSTIVYETIAHKLSDGTTVFRGIRTLGGVSGSPFFVLSEVVNEDGEISESYTYAGSIGKNVSSEYDLEYSGNERWQMEIIEDGGVSVPMTSNVIQPGQIYQHYSYPGSGKTRSIIPQTIITGLKVCSNIIVAGPTRVVAKELYDSLKDTNPDLMVTLHVKGSKDLVRNARVIITTHASLLGMLHRRAAQIRASTGYIIDETHFTNSKTRFLMSFLRNKFIDDDSRRGFLFETTATGYSLSKHAFQISKGSNFPIQEKNMNPNWSFSRNVCNIVEKHISKRSIIFCPRVRGKDGVLEVAREIRDLGLDIKVVTLHRRNYNQVAPQLTYNKDEPIVIVTTNISECGANYNVDICIDCGKQISFTRLKDESHVFKAVVMPITQTQYIQRRGRVGRRKNGVYYKPADLKLEDLQPTTSQNEAEVFDLMVYNQNMEFENYSEFETTLENIMLTASQLRGWATSTDEDSINNPIIYKMVFNKDASLTGKETRMRRIQEMLSGPEEITITDRRKQVTIKVSHWDDRDLRWIRKMLKMANKVLDAEISGDESEDEREYNVIARIKTKEYRIVYDTYREIDKSVKIGNQLYTVEPARVPGVKSERTGIFQKETWTPTAPYMDFEMDDEKTNE